MTNMQLFISLLMNLFRWTPSVPSIRFILFFHRFDMKTVFNIWSLLVCGCMQSIDILLIAHTNKGMPVRITICSKRFQMVFFFDMRTYCVYPKKMMIRRQAAQKWFRTKSITCTANTRSYTFISFSCACVCVHTSE